MKVNYVMIWEKYWQTPRSRILGEPDQGCLLVGWRSVVSARGGYGRGRKTRWSAECHTGRFRKVRRAKKKKKRRALDSEFWLLRDHTHTLSNDLAWRRVKSKLLKTPGDELRSRQVTMMRKRGPGVLAASWSQPQSPGHTHTHT